MKRIGFCSGFGALAGVMALGALLLAPRSSWAQFQLDHRTSFFDITFSDLSFSDANAHYDVLSTGTSGPLDSSFNTSGITMKSDHTGAFVEGVGSTVLSNIVEFTDHWNFDNFTPANSPDGYHFFYDTAAATQFTNVGLFGNTWIVRKNFGGTVGLEFQGGGTGILDNTGHFDLDMLINGDWSTFGTGPGQTEFVGINPLWTVDKNFVFDGTNTEFAAHIDVYNGNNANVDFILHGNAPFVPEPGSLALFATFGMAAGLALRKRIRQ